MTPDELRELRARIDVARRERIAREEQVEAERAPRLCEFCGKPIPPERVGRGKFVARFCEPNHRQYAYYRRRRAALA